MSGIAESGRFIAAAGWNSIATGGRKRRKVRSWP